VENEVEKRGLGICTADPPQVAEPFDTLRVSGFLSLMVSLSNHAYPCLCGEYSFTVNPEEPKKIKLRMEDR
jgi:hypothetical protein